MIPSFSFDRSKCLNCDDQLSADTNSLWCPNCEPKFPQPGSGRVACETLIPRNVISIGELEVVYIKLESIFSLGEFLWVRAEAEVTSVPGNGFILRATKATNGVILVDTNSMPETTNIGMKTILPNEKVLLVMLVDLNE